MPRVYIYICIGMLLLAIAPMPYGYYKILRWVACGTFGFAWVVSYQKNHEVLPWMFGALAILFNPVYPIVLTREVWFFFDIGAALLLYISANALDEADSGNMERKPTVYISKEIMSGSDYQHAIHVYAAEQEYEWIRENYPRAKIGNQELHATNDGPVDVIDIELPDGTSRKVYFNITGSLLKFASDAKVKHEGKG